MSQAVSWVSKKGNRCIRVIDDTDSVHYERDSMVLDCTNKQTTISDDLFVISILRMISILSTQTFPVISSLPSSQY